LTNDQILEVKEFENKIFRDDYFPEREEALMELAHENHIARN
jgi:hypothetical protein